MLELSINRVNCWRMGTDLSHFEGNDLIILGTRGNFTVVTAKDASPVRRNLHGGS